MMSRARVRMARSIASTPFTADNTVNPWASSTERKMPRMIESLSATMTSFAPKSFGMPAASGTILLG